MRKEKRFEVKSQENHGIFETYKVVTDQETGVNYLVWQLGFTGGITPLLDSEGKVVITE